jgi:hypothetical protein
MENPREMMMEVEAEVSSHNGEITANPPTEEEEEASKREQLEEVRKRDKERLRDLRKQQKDALQEARSQQNQVVEAQEVSFLDLLDYPGEGGGVEFRMLSCMFPTGPGQVRPSQVSASAD